MLEHGIRVQIDLAELGHDQKKPVVLIQLGNLFLKSEVLDDFTGAAGEAFDVLGQVGGDIVGVALELLKGEGTGVMEGLPSDTV